MVDRRKRNGRRNNADTGNCGKGNTTTKRGASKADLAACNKTYIILLKVILFHLTLSSTSY